MNMVTHSNTIFHYFQDSYGVYVFLLVATSGPGVTFSVSTLSTKKEIIYSILVMQHVLFTLLVSGRLHRSR